MSTALQGGVNVSQPNPWLLDRLGSGPLRLCTSALNSLRYVPQSVIKMLQELDLSYMHMHMCMHMLHVHAHPYNCGARARVRVRVRVRVSSTSGHIANLQFGTPRIGC